MSMCFSFTQAQKIKTTFAYLSARLSLPDFIGRRKVRTAQGNTPANGRVPTCREQQVPQKITALTNHWGKGENVR